MAYFLDLFSPETHEAFTKSDRYVSGFRFRQRNQASKIKPGDKLVCYMTKLSRWIGVLEVKSTCYQDDTPIFYKSEDPFVIRFKVEPIVWLDKELAIPVHEKELWEKLSFTKGYKYGQIGWTGKFRVSLNAIPEEDGIFLEQVLKNQTRLNRKYEINEKEAKYLTTHLLKTQTKEISVTIPENEEVVDAESKGTLRESIKVQGLLADIGEKMNFKIWIPRSDRSKVATCVTNTNAWLDVLPLNYDEITLKTIEQIDVLWIKGRSIVRAFEVEHTTSVYSGILRMADLSALQPNMDIKLHIVAPEERRDKVFSEIKRPVFSVLEKGPLSENCTFISYDSVHILSSEKHLGHLSDSVLDEYEETAE